MNSTETDQEVQQENYQDVQGDEQQQSKQQSEKHFTSSQLPRIQSRQDLISLNGSELLGSLTYSRSLGLIKKARSQVEEDAKLLANRIQLLRLEDQKTLKKIAETKQKTNNVQELKRQNLIKTIKRKESIDKQIEIQQVHKIQREQKRMERQQILEQRLMDKYERAQTIKSLSQQMTKKKNLIDLKFLQGVQQRSEIVKQAKLQAKLRQQEYYELKKMNIQNQVLSKIQLEEELKAQKEEIVRKLEREELDLIQKLQASQLLQKQCYEELECALVMNSDEYNNAFSNFSDDEYLQKQKKYNNKNTAIQLITDEQGQPELHTEDQNETNQQQNNQDQEQ